MAQLHKNCSHCGKSFEATTEFFHRNKAYKDGMLPHCKTCQNEKTAEYRIGKGKNYWFDENGRDGWFRNPTNKRKWIDYLSEKFSANYNCKIYAIINPEGKVYIGFTKHPKLEIRMRNHKNDYVSHKKGRKKWAIPLLYESFDRWEFDKHTAILIEELDSTDKSKGLEREKYYIQQYMSKGISLNSKL